MIVVTKNGVLLSKTSLVFEDVGVLNPAVIQNEKGLHLFYRAVTTGNRSSIGYCKLSNATEIEDRYEQPVIVPEYGYESQGVEDPRIVKIDNLYYLTYTAYDGVNAMGALAISKDLIKWNKLGIIVPQNTYNQFTELTANNQHICSKYARFNEHFASLLKDGKPMFLWDKNLIFFPRRINGKLHFLHRIKPEIQIVAFNDISELTKEFWDNYFQNFNEHIVLSAKHKHESSYIGGGCPPIETKEGWLVIYHSVFDTVNGYVYNACAALLELENPQKEIARLPYPLFTPTLDIEINGEVNNVCFPTGTALFNDDLYIYYGAADEQIATVSVSFEGLITELLLNKLN